MYISTIGDQVLMSNGAIATIGSEQSDLPVTENLVSWFDAADASSIVLNSSNVAQWNDKSGNEDHAIQNTALKQPLYVADALNGKGAIRFFNAVDSYLSFTGFAVDTHTIYIVANPTASHAHTIEANVGVQPAWNKASRFAINVRGTPNYPNIGLNGNAYQGVSVATNGLAIIDTYTNMYNATSLYPTTITSPTLVTTQTENLATSLFINGAFVHTGLTGGTSAVQNISMVHKVTSTQIGGFDYFNSSYAGDIYEIAIFEAVHDEATRTLFSNFFMNKWGL